VDAVLATCAAQPEFIPATVGTGFRKVEYISPGIGASNPIRHVLSEAQKYFGGEPSISLLLSLGSGHPGVISLPRDGGSDALYQMTQKLAVDCEEKAREIQEQVDEEGVYFRFSVEQGMQRDLDADVDELGWIVTQTDVYLADPITVKKIEDCVHNIGSGTIQISLSLLSALYTSCLPCHH
jgi:hypothetical protein